MNLNPKAAAIFALALRVVLLATFPGDSSTLDHITFLIMVTPVFFVFEKP